VSDEVRAPEEPTPGSEGAEARSATPPAATEAPAPISGRAHSLFWLAIGCAAIGVLQVPIIFLAHRSSHPDSGASPAPSVVASVRPSASASQAAAPAPAMSVAPAGDPGPPSFRISELESEAIEVVHARVGKRTCVQTLEALGVVAVDLPKIATAMSPIRKLDGCLANDRIFVAIGRTDRRLHGVELETAPGEIVRVTETKSGELTAEAVKLPVTHKRYATAFVVVSDLATAIAGAGLDASLIEPLDEAIGSRQDVPAPTRGSTFRVVADATLVGGTFDRFDNIAALEYQPRADLAPLRLYHVAKASNAKNHGWFDAKGHQPVRAHWRMPLAFPRITSRFNPRRRHPVLKVIMPHNGCDFAAPPGTPVYSIGAGIVTFRGEAGPSGNLITIQHDASIESGYAHLSRYAPGVVPGTHVEARTLIGYVGTTGRSTGPHLHLSVKRSGTFIDPLALKMDGFRVVPPSERSGFTSQKSEADALLDAIPIAKVDLPAAAPAPSASVEPEGQEDDHPH